MKILDEGKVKVPWWVNKVLVCPDCNRVVQLERKDADSPDVLLKDDGSLAVYCPNCKTVTMDLKRN